jgi:hypothetical protein
MAIKLGLLSQSKPMKPYRSVPVPTNDEIENQPALTMEEVLKRKREKLASDKLGIPPEVDSAV